MQFAWKKSVCLCLSVCPSVCLSVCLSERLSERLSNCYHVDHYKGLARLIDLLYRAGRVKESEKFLDQVDVSAPVCVLEC